MSLDTLNTQIPPPSPDELSAMPMTSLLLQQLIRLNQDLLVETKLLRDRIVVLES